jgi:hypothetical protein
MLCYRAVMAMPMLTVSDVVLPGRKLQLEDLMSSCSSKVSVEGSGKNTDRTEGSKRECEEEQEKLEALEALLPVLAQ